MAMQGNAEDGDVLILTSHHSILDGWGERQLVQQLSAAYDSCLASTTQSDSSQEDSRDHMTSATLPDLPVQYTDFSHWQRQQMEEGAWKGHVEYWQTQLAGIPEALDLPSDHIRPNTPSGEGHQLQMHIPKSLYRAIQSCADQQQATVLMVLASVFQVGACWRIRSCMPVAGYMWMGLSFFVMLCRRYLSCTKYPVQMLCSPGHLR